VRYLAANGRTGIRRLAPRDQDEFCRLALLSRDLHHPWLSPPTTPEGFAGFVRRGRDRDSERFAVHTVDSGDMVGYVVINNIVRRDLRSGALGYGAFLPHAGQGYLTEGVELVVGHAFGPLGLHRVEAYIRPANLRSKALVGRLGFACEGLSRNLLLDDGAWRDHERWAFTAEMLAPRPAAVEEATPSTRR
jgi:[ribosomal protein S5]-alanine N-acetyltransferase